MSSSSESHTIPPAQVQIDLAVVRQLLAARHPDLAGLALEQVAEGWDNVMVRVGPDLCARLPRRAVAVELILAEQRLLPRLAPQLPLPVPAPVRTGGPVPGVYDWPWSLVLWLPGAPVGTRTLAPGSGAILGRFLAALHSQSADDAPRSAVRGGALAERDAAVAPRLERLGATHPQLAGPARTAWQRALAAPPTPVSVLLHGDLHPRNVLASADGQLTAVIDWGDICRGDPATDLAALWLLLPDAAERAACLAAYGKAHPVDDWLVARACGWAVNLGSILLETGLASDAGQAAQGAMILGRIAGS
jgi:aminoglycoside phosphotransferase (APT) family kinase protein